MKPDSEVEPPITADGRRWGWPAWLNARCWSGFIRVHLRLSAVSKLKLALPAVLAAAGLLRAGEPSTPTAKAASTETHISSKSVEFDLKSRQATYRGNVVVDDPRVNLSCDVLTARLPTNGTRVDSIIAESNVVILIPEKGATNRATADKATYIYTVAAGVTNEVLELTGSPAIETPQGTMTGTKITWDRARNNLSAENSHMIYKPSTNAPTSITPTNAAPEPKPSTP